MRLRACMGALLLCAGCVGLPETVSIEVDGRTIELRQHGFEIAPSEGQWSSSEDCRSTVMVPVTPGATVRSFGEREIEIVGADGSLVRLHRCPL